MSAAPVGWFEPSHLPRARAPFAPFERVSRLRGILFTQVLAPIPQPEEADRRRLLPARESHDDGPHHQAVQAPRQVRAASIDVFDVRAADAGERDGVLWARALSPRLPQDVDAGAEADGGEGHCACDQAPQGGRRRASPRTLIGSAHSRTEHKRLRCPSCRFDPPTPFGLSPAQEYLGRYQYAPELDEHEVKHWLLPIDDVIYSYVVVRFSMSTCARLLSDAHLITAESTRCLWRFQYCLLRRRAPLGRSRTSSASTRSRPP